MTLETRIDVTAFEKVAARLEEALRAYQDTPDNLFVLDSVIKRFELTYIQSIRVMERFLLDHAPIAPDRDASFREMVEAAMEFGLTQASWGDWLEFRKARNKTAQTYLEEVQRGLVNQASRFLPVARYVLETVTGGQPVMSNQGAIDLNERDLALVRSIVLPLFSTAENAVSPSERPVAA